MQTIFAVLLMFGSASAMPGTIRMSIDVAHPERVKTVTLTIVSLANQSARTDAQPITAIDRLETRTLAPGTYDFTIAADHHRTVTRRVIARAGETLTLGVIPLAELPVIRGSVTSGGAPVAGATVRPPSAGASAVTTDARGAFALEFEAQRPDYLVVEAAGRGTRVVGVTPGTTGLALSAVELGAPASLEVTVRRPAGKPQPLDVLLGVADQQLGPRWVAQRRLGAGESKARFASLGAASYTLLVRGSEPLQQSSTLVVLGQRDRRAMSFEISAKPVRVHVQLGDHSLPKANVRLLNQENATKTSFITDDAGVWRGEAWQAGRYLARVAAPSLPTTVHAQVTIGAENRSIIALPTLSVRGRVIDAASGAPVANALMLLHSEVETGAATVPSRTNADGRFEYRSVPAGHQTIETRATGYLFPETIAFDLAGDHASREVEIRADRGVRKELVVRDAHGGPVAGAFVICAADNAIRSRSTTGDDGRALVPIPRDGCAIYVIPPNAPFTSVRVGRSQLGDDARLPTVVTGPRGSLEVVAKTTAGEPIANVRMVVRYNGEIVPPEVVRLIETAQGLSFRTDGAGMATLPNLPLGAYEMWPYRTDDEAERIIAAGTFAPIQLTLKTGENQVTVKFRARH